MAAVTKSPEPNSQSTLCLMKAHFVPCGAGVARLACWQAGWMDGERTRLSTFHSRPAGKQPRKVLADIHAQKVVSAEGGWR